jgi:hypothetical protein
MIRDGAMPLPHWVFFPSPPVDGLGAVRVRIYRPVSDSRGLTQRTKVTSADGARALAREFYQNDDKCIEEHWWQRDAVPGGLLPAVCQPSRAARAVLVGQQDPGRETAPEDGGIGQVRSVPRPLRLLVVALEAVLAGDPRSVISVAARFGDLPAGAAARAIRLGGGAEGRLSIGVEADNGHQILLATMWFGCGSRSLRRPWAA